VCQPRNNNGQEQLEAPTFNKNGLYHQGLVTFYLISSAFTVKPIKLSLAMTLYIIHEGMTIFEYCGLQSSDHGVIDFVVTAEDAPNPTNDL